MSLEYRWDAGLSEKVDCTFTEDDGAIYLDKACIQGVDISKVFLTPKQVDRIHELAYAHFERQARELRAERLYESRMERIAA